MRRLQGLLLGLALTVSGAGPLAAEDPPAQTPLPDPVDTATWRARDAEGRWALFLARSTLRPGPLPTPWIEFLERQGNWQQLEWVALATNSSQATGVLAKLKNPVWVRCCVWCLGASDSHAFTSAKQQLLARPDVVRGWFALHPQAATGPAQKLLTELNALGSGRDMRVAKLLAPPHDPQVLLAALVPPTKLVDFGERTRAEPGVTYVHQVGRALAILEHSQLTGEPWAGRLAALLEHGSPAVRRAAALAATGRPWRELPVDRLLARMDAADERPDVRSAAVLALSSLQPTRAYLRVLEVALDPRHPAFTAAVSRLADIDTGFLLEAWATLDAAPAGPEGVAFLRAQRERLAARLVGRPEEDHATWVQSQLALAAEADLGGAAVAASLVQWTKRTLAIDSAWQKVHQALEAAAEGFDGGDWTTDAAHAAALTERGRALAQDVLGREAPAAK